MGRKGIERKGSAHIQTPVAAPGQLGSPEALGLLSALMGLGEEREILKSPTQATEPQHVMFNREAHSTDV